jgi:predicted  nucleic acid-binding Zn-ribbon protein
VDAVTTIHWLSSLARFEEELERSCNSAARSLKRRQELSERLQQDEEELATQLRQQEELSRQIRAQEREIKDLESQITRLRQQQDQVKDNKSYRALSQQIETLLSQLDEKETEALRQMELLEAGQRQCRTLDEEIQQKRTEVDRQRAQLKEAAATAEAEQRELEREIATCTQQLPNDIAAKLAHLRTRLALPVVRLDEQACGGCHAQFPTQVALEIEKSQSVVRCQGCGRFVVLIA